MKYVVVGCGISGAVFARILAEAGCQVEIWERRNHIAGNMHDYIDNHGILVHQYGPHIFHTSNEKVWKFVSRFEEWKPFKLVCGASWDGKYTPTAFNFTTIDVFYPEEQANRLKKKLLDAYPGKDSATVVEVLQNEDPDIKGFAEFLFQNDYAPYTAKQWGVSAAEIDPSVLKRVPIRFSYEEAYFNDTYEAMPVHSYTEMFENMLNHPNISVKLSVEAKEKIILDSDEIKCKDISEKVKFVYTGALDELFDSKYGELPYRSLRFDWMYEDIDSLQEAPVVAYPKAKGYTRITEYKKLPVQNVKGTSYAIEYPLPYKSGQKNEPYYPVLTDDSALRYQKYEKQAQKIGNLICCGRLANFKYYNMDQAINEAINIAEKEVKAINAHKKID